MINQRKNHLILKIIPITLALMFITSGCERALTKVSEPDEEIKSFQQAIEKGDINSVKRLIAEGVNVNATDEEDQSALHIAVGYNHKDIAVARLGFNSNARSQQRIAINSSNIPRATSSRTSPDSLSQNHTFANS